MSNSTNKPESREVIEPGAGTALGMEMLDGIAGGNDPDQLAAFNIELHRERIIRTAIDAFRDAHPSASPDDVREFGKTIDIGVGLQGKSGA
jgi:hypothetical protein